MPREIHIATMGCKLIAAQRLKIADFRFDERKFPLGWIADPRRGVAKAGARLLGLARTIQPRLIHHNTLPLAHLSFSIPYVVTVHPCVWSWEENLSRATRNLQAAEGRCYSLAKKDPPQCHVAKRRKEPFIVRAKSFRDVAKVLGSSNHLMPRLYWPVQEGAAHFVSSNDEVVGAIGGLIVDPESRVPLGWLAREWFRQFCEETMVKGYSAAYARVLSGALCVL